MHDSERICANCGRNRADYILHTAHGTNTASEAWCEACIRSRPDTQMDLGMLVQALLGSVFGQRNVIPGPRSHPDADPHVSEIFFHAVLYAMQKDETMCDTHHLLAAMLRNPVSTRAFADAGVTVDQQRQLRQKLSAHLNLGAMLPKLEELSEDVQILMEMSPFAKDLLQNAQRLAADSGTGTITPEILVQAMLATQVGPAAGLLDSVGHRPAADAAGAGAGSSSRPQAPTRRMRPRRRTPALSHFGRDLTAEAAEGKIDPVIGRDAEIEQTIETLARRRKNNVALIGEPGVGKTAIVEGLALRIVNGEVPESLRDRQIIALDLSAMIAGSGLRGLFEQRLKTAIDEVIASDGQIILFIDELHTIVGAGAAEGAMDAANIFKPLLARGELNCIGATTLDEYRRHIESDGALSRRFRAITVAEPTVDETIDILRGLKAGYEAHHKTVITDEALIAAARLSDRYISDHFLPDKAVDLIDEASAKVRMAAVEPDGEVAELRAQLQQAESEKEQAKAADDFQRASELKQRAEKLQARLSELENRALAAAELRVTENDVAAVVARRTNIPVGHMLKSDAEKLLDLEQQLSRSLVGQQEAISLVSDAVRHSRTGLADPSKPVATFMFLGPTGVGKTELAKQLTRQLFGTEDALIRVDMSEYMEKHNVARLIGAPPGYIGHDEGGQLTEAVRRRPYSIILLDEIEKAHPDVFNILLQVMDDGRLTDGTGRVVDFRHSIIIMTSNLGAGTAKRPLGFAADTDTERDSRQVLDALRSAMRPEFLNRIDETIVFRSLTEDECRQIVNIIVGEIGERLAAAHDGAQLHVSDALLRRLTDDGFDAEMGARPLRRHLRRTLERALDAAILRGQISAGTVVHADLAPDGTVALAFSDSAPAPQPAAAAAV